MIRIVITFLTSLVALTILSCSGGSSSNVAVDSGNRAGNAAATPHTPLPAATIDELASGRKLYADNCQICHKENGTGGEVEFEGKKLNPDDLSSAKIKGFSDEKIIGYIKNGIEEDGMPAFEGKLSEAEMRDVVKYVRTEIQKMPAQAAQPPKS